jgi:predicted nucleic acid-binding protein
VIVLLDTGVLGLIINSKPSDKNREEVRQCNEWMENLLKNNIRIVVSEIADYEERRELILQNKLNNIQRLDALISRVGYFRITTDVMREAAKLWAFTRKEGKQTADNKALDADVILCAQAIIAKREGIDVIIATSDPGDLNRLLRNYYISARRWRDILP